MSLARILTRQAGVISLAQAVREGVSASTVQRWTRQGEWERLHPAVYLAGGHRLTDEARVRAAWLWAGESAAVSGVAAAFWHGMLDRILPEVELTLPRQTHLRERPGIVLRRRDLPPIDTVSVRRLRVTDVPLTTLDTAVTLPNGSTFLDRALQRHVRFPALYRAYCRNVGRTGSSQAGRMIIAAADHADSAAERLLVSLLRAAGIEGWVLGYPFGPYRIDLAFPAARLAIEVDGWAWHVDADRFRTDRRKGNAITREGWDLLRFTWHDLHGEPTATIREIGSALGNVPNRTRTRG
ncbi:type IV toxin-antitoxin system AbiEi family antitoxin domain-containing protein [Pseudonocardia sp. GCM10023141]|uniref:type IV toxin-antitoxin system AbiEi family antitoxin domain-containing protein n=1 Tax=Pseudonocardia sp. GCM10023141 TaxID=3252653 RepID=UPI003607B788